MGNFCLALKNIYVYFFSEKGKKKNEDDGSNSKTDLFGMLLPFTTLCYDVVMVVDLPQTMVHVVYMEIILLYYYISAKHISAPSCQLYFELQLRTRPSSLFNIYIIHINICSFLYTFKDTVDIGEDSAYGGVPTLCTEDYANFCEHGQCEIKYSIPTCR